MRILVIGGGASGFMAAITAKRLSPGASVIIAEKNDRVLKKALSTGNGRCNITNRLVSPESYNRNAASFVRQALKRFGFSDAERFFLSIGIPVEIEDEGRAYPMSRQASSVVDMLRAEAARLGIEERASFGINSFKRHGKSFLAVSDKGTVACDRIILSAGSASGGGSRSGYSLAESVGHSITPLFPSIVQLKSEDARPLHGIKFEGRASIYINSKEIESKTGEILFTEYGLSGPPVMHLSRHASGFFAKQRRGEAFMSFDLLPDLEYVGLYEMLRHRRASLKELSAELFLVGLINKKLSLALMKRAGASLAGRICDLSDETIGSIARIMKGWRFNIQGVMPFGNSQATAGGIALNEIEPSTMESRKNKGLFITGEIADVDGICGGYNLHWAWASGFIAGSCAVKG